MKNKTIVLIKDFYEYIESIEGATALVDKANLNKLTTILSNESFTEAKNVLATKDTLDLALTIVNIYKWLYSGYDEDDVHNVVCTINTPSVLTSEYIDYDKLSDDDRVLYSLIHSLSIYELVRHIE